MAWADMTLMVDAAAAGILSGALLTIGTAIVAAIRILVITIREIQSDYKILITALVGMQKEQTTAITQGAMTITGSVEINKQTLGKVEVMSTRLEAGLSRQEQIQKALDDLKKD